jgi:hypothetical protein
VQYVRSGATLLVALAVMRGQPGPAFGHGNHGGPTGGAAHAGAGIAVIRPDESLKLSVDVLGYLSGSLASAWRTGEPLGAGGKIPLFYNQKLHIEAPFERAAPAKRDYWPQYRDFSYIPVWLPSQLGARVQYRFLPTLGATVSAVYFGSVDRPTLEPNPLEFEEMFVRWSPEKVRGLSFSIGQLFLLGSYSPSFDQFPLESFRFNGLALDYQRPFGDGQLRLRAAGGRMPLGRTTNVEIADPEPVFNHPFVDGVRERSHLYLTAGLARANGFSLDVLGGYQVLPEDSSISNDRSPSLTTVWPKSSGYQAGLQLGLSRGGLEQYLMASYGKGDVEMAWGAPDWVYREDAYARRDRFMREGSSLLQAVYWGGFTGRRFRLVAGAWGQWRRPKAEQRMWTIINGLTSEPERIVATTMDFRAAKTNLIPTYTWGLLSIGVRLDGLYYFDKHATTDTIEPQADQALRPLYVQEGTAMTYADLVQGPSRWEREAVDCAIVTPFVDVSPGEIFRIRAAWSGAWYSSPIRRQRGVSNFHANVTISAWLIYRFGIAAEADRPDQNEGEHDPLPES